MDYKSKDAEFILNSDAYKSAVKRLNDHIDSNMLIANPDNKEQAQRLIITKQLANVITRELEALINDYEFDKHVIQLEEEKVKYKKYR